MKNFKLYTKEFKRKVLARAALFMGLSVSLTGCGQDVNEQTNEPTPGTEIIMETETNNNKTEIEVIVEGMLDPEIKEKTTKENKVTTKKEENSIEEIYEEIEENSKENKESTTENKTTAETKETTTDKKDTNTKTSISAPGTPGLKKSTQPSSQTTQIPTTTSKATTKKTTATTTKKTTTTTTTTTQAPTEPVTEAPTQPPVTYDYTLENITQSADVFNQISGQMNGGILHGSSILMDDCNGNEYWTYGDKEAKVALLLMNDNAAYKDGVLSNVFTGYSDDEIKNGALYLYRLAVIEEYTNVDIDFNNYVMDGNIANYMNKLRNAARVARETGNCDELNNVLYMFAEDENYQYLQNNYAAIMLTIGYGSRIENNNYYGLFTMMKIDDMSTYENTSSEIVKRHIY